MLKDYRSRVIGTYDFLRFTLAEVSQNPDRLLRVGREADEQTVAMGTLDNASRRFPVDYELTDVPTPYHLKAVEYYAEESDVSGDLRVVFGKKALDLTVPLYRTFRVRTAVVPPLYYVVPPQWHSVIDLLKAHGLHLKTLAQQAVLSVESYRFSNVKWPSGPFEGRQMPSFTAEPIQESRTYPAGSAIVSLAQPLAKVAINLLEPQAPDSLVAWGFFNAIFEQKEYAEHYILEDLAREMMAQDSALRREFEQRLATDPEFASNPSERLQFFYRRSPYWDAQKDVYPVARVTFSPDLSFVDEK
jgi:hypothetical protein